MKTKIIVLALMLSLIPALANARGTSGSHGFRVPSNSFVWHPYHPTRNHRHF